MTTARTGESTFSNDNKPVTINQILSNSMPRLPLYLNFFCPSNISTPAAIANKPKSVSPPGMRIPNTGTMPVAINQIASRIQPKLCTEHLAFNICRLPVPGILQKWYLAQFYRKGKREKDCPTDGFSTSKNPWRLYMIECIKRRPDRREEKNPSD